MNGVEYSRIYKNSKNTCKKIFMKSLPFLKKFGALGWGPKIWGRGF
jgi:hypothetical protein